MSDYKAKMHQNSISTGAPPQTPLGSLQRSPDLLTAFKTLRGLLRVGEGKGRKGKRKGKGQ